jgi:hypothetical protein
VFGPAEKVLSQRGASGRTRIFSKKVPSLMRRTWNAPSISTQAMSPSDPYHTHFFHRDFPAKGLGWPIRFVQQSIDIVKHVPSELNQAGMGTGLPPS